MVDASTQNRYVWDEHDLKTIQNYREYYIRCLNFIDTLENDGPVDLKFPKKPTEDLSVLLGKTKKGPLSGDLLHEYLAQNLIRNPNHFSIIMKVSEVSEIYRSNLNEVKYCLKTGYHRLQKHHSTSIQNCLDFGEWLLLAYSLFEKEKLRRSVVDGCKTWKIWLSTHIGLCDGYGRQLRQMAQLLGNYPKFRQLGISFSELRKHRQQIALLMENPQFAAFWGQP